MAQWLRMLAAKSKKLQNPCAESDYPKLSSDLRVSLCIHPYAQIHTLNKLKLKDVFLLCVMGKDEFEIYLRLVMKHLPKCTGPRMQEALS